MSLILGMRAASLPVTPSLLRRLCGVARPVIVVDWYLGHLCVI